MTPFEQIIFYGWFILVPLIPGVLIWCLWKFSPRPLLSTPWYLKVGLCTIVCYYWSRTFVFGGALRGAIPRAMLHAQVELSGSAVAAAKLKQFDTLVALNELIDEAKVVFSFVLLVVFLCWSVDLVIKKFATKSPA